MVQTWDEAKKHETVNLLIGGGGHSRSRVMSKSLHAPSWSLLVAGHYKMFT